MAFRVSQITHSAVEKLLNDRYAVIPFSHVHVPGALQGWNQFLDEPQEVKDGWTIDVEGAGDPDDGYFRRTGTLQNGILDDIKQGFHYRYRLHPRLHRKGVSVDLYRVWIMHTLSELHRQCAATSRMIARALDSRIHGYQFAERVGAAPAVTTSVLRLLSYDLQAARIKPVIGKRHIDKSFLTIHIAEERPGLRFARETHPYQPRSRTALIFFGDKAARLTNDLLKPLWHEVIDTSENPSALSRWSIVYFCHILME